MRSALAAAAVASCLLASSAQARSITSAAVALDRRQDAEAAEVAWAVRTFLQNDPRADYVDPASLVQSESPAQRAQKAEQARLKLAKGLETFDEMDVPAALARLQEAQALAEAADLSVSMPVLLDILAAKALVLHAQGSKADAGNDFALLFSLRPYDVDPKRLTPEASATVEEAKARVSNVPPTILEVQTPPASAWVFVDGVYKGVSPLEARGFTPGVHYVTAVAPGYEFVQQRALVGPGLVTKLPLVPSPTGQALLARIRQIQAGLLGGAGADAVAGLAQWARTDEALVVGVRKQEGSLFLTGLRVAASDGHVLARMEREAGARVVPSEVEAFTRDLLASDLPRLPKGVPAAALVAAAPPPPSLAGAGKRGAGIALVSIGGLVATAGAIVGIVANVRAEDARNVPMIDRQRHQQFASEAKDLALAADLCYTGGALSLAGGAALLVLGVLDARASSADKAAPASKPSQPGSLDSDRLDEKIDAPKEPEKARPQDKEKKDKEKPKERDPFGDDEVSLGISPTPGGAAVFLRGVF